jgi:hypothetical protein
VISEALYRRARLILSIGERRKDVYAWLPLRVESRANLPTATRHGRMAAAKKHKIQRASTCLALRAPLAHVSGRLSSTTVVRMVRYAPRQLDDDNLASALKSVRDGVADALGVDDRDPRVVWVCDQLSSPTHGVAVEIYLEVPCP